MQVHLQTPTPDLNKSLTFYEQIGFKTIQRDQSWYAVEKGAYIEINTERTARAGIKVYDQNWENKVADINYDRPILEFENHYLTTGVSGVFIYLMKTQFPELELESEASLLGNFAGISLETIDMKLSVDLWQQFGFQIDSGGVDQGWVALKNEAGLGLSFMNPNSCPHLFANPSFTYFNSGKNPEIIAQLRERSVPIAEEITFFNDQGIVDNIILKDPGGFGFFVFND